MDKITLKLVSNEDNVLPPGPADKGNFLLGVACICLNPRGVMGSEVMMTPQLADERKMES